MKWTRVSLVVDGEAAEAVAEALRPFGYGGVSLEQASLDLSPSATVPTLSDEITVSIYLSALDDNPKVHRRIQEVLWHLGQLYPIPEPSFDQVYEDDWANAWKRHYHPLRLGKRILVCPAWEKVDPRPDDILVVMDPGMAFGTGLHPTTRMCLEVLEDVIQEGMRVLDVGTGSGILSIVAAQLGAHPVLGVDTDEVAVQAARRSCALNNVAGAVQVEHGSLSDHPPLAGGWDIVLANILAPDILGLFDEGLADHVRPGGLLVLAGIIEEQATEVMTALSEKHLLVERRQIKDWVTLVGRRIEA